MATHPDPHAIALTLFLSLAPGFEGRYATIVALSMGLSPLLSTAIPILGEVVLALALSTLASYIDRVLSTLAQRKDVVGKVATFIERRIAFARSKARRYVEKWGAIGLALFVAVPLPVTGVWTGALVGYLLGIERKRMFLALAVGGAASVLIVALPAILVSKLGVGMP